MEEKRLTMFQAGIIFSVSVALFVLFSIFNPFNDFYVAGLVGEVVPILLPAVAGVLIFRKNLRPSLGLNPVSPGNMVLAIFITLLIMPANMLLNALNMWLVKVVFGRNIPAEIPVPETTGELVASLLVIGLAAAVCEEIFFRGALLNSMRKLGRTGMFIVVSMIFAAFHFNIEQFLGIFTLSLFITYVVYRTGSVFIGVAAHFTNNAAAVLLSHFASGMAETAAAVEPDMEMPAGGQLAVLLAVAVLSLTLAGALIYVFHQRTRRTVMEDGTSRLKSGDVVSYIPGLVIMGAMFLLTVAAYIIAPASMF